MDLFLSRDFNGGWKTIQFLFYIYIFIQMYIELVIFFICSSIVYLPIFTDDSDSYDYLRRIVVFYVHSLFFLLSALYIDAPLNNRDMF